MYLVRYKIHVDHIKLVSILKLVATNTNLLNLMICGSQNMDVTISEIAEMASSLIAESHTHDGCSLLLDLFLKKTMD